jgi:DNA-binding NarL/FixJ family response regulator
VDDHEVGRSWVASLLEAADDIVIAGEAGSVQQGGGGGRADRPDAVVMVVRLAGRSVIESSRVIGARRPNT